jgi:hypothetical protein
VRKPSSIPELRHTYHFGGVSQLGTTTRIHLTQFENQA